MESSNTYTILSLCGGGMRGLLSAAILERIRKDLPGGERFMENVDCLAGTSTGSLIAAMLLNGIAPLGIVESYRLFLAPYFRSPKSTDGNSPGYSDDSIIKKLIGEAVSKPLSGYKKDLVFTAFSLAKSNATGNPASWGPVIYNNLQKDPALDPLLYDAVSSSCAMPGMVPPHVFKLRPGDQDSVMVDGGFASHDPSLAAICLALQKGVPLENIRLICIGTGFMPNWIDSDTQGWGANQWISGSEVDPSRDNLPGLLYGHDGPTPVMSMLLNGTSTQFVQNMVQWILPAENVAYINPVLIPYISETDARKETLDILQKAGDEAEVSGAVKILSNALQLTQ